MTHRVSMQQSRLDVFEAILTRQKWRKNNNWPTQPENVNNAVMLAHTMTEYSEVEFLLAEIDRLTLLVFTPKLIMDSTDGTPSQTTQ